MNEDSNPNLRRTSKEIFLQDSVNNHTASNSEKVENGATTSGTTEDDNNLKHTTVINSGFHNLDKDPMFVIVDSGGMSNPSSNEILNNNKSICGEVKRKRCFKNKVIPDDIPTTSRVNMEFMTNYFGESESGELQMVDINLESENEISLGDDNDFESIVITYLRDKNSIGNKDDKQVSTRRKSTILENVLKMETITEGEQNSSAEISENSLDVHIPSYPGSPRSLNFGSGHSLDAFDDQDQNLREAVEFLHQDKEFLMAAEIGNDKLLEIYIRRGTDIQQKDHLGRNALHLAVCSDSLRAIKLLLYAGVMPNVKDNLGMTPLSLCLMRRPSLIVANLLFDHGAIVMPRSNPMDTGLFIQFVMMCVPTAEDETMLRLLVDKGALINDLSAPGGRQALHFASMSNNTRLIQILFDLGADLSLENHRHETAKEVALTFRCKEAYNLLFELELLTDEIMTDD